MIHKRREFLVSVEGTKNGKKEEVLITHIKTYTKYEARKIAENDAAEQCGFENPKATKVSEY